MGPDAVGSICFLVASGLAYAAVCHGRGWWQARSPDWRIAALNLLGSVAFGIAAVASLVEPSTSEPVSAAIANAGTTAGALCFLAGAIMLLPAPTAAGPPSGAQQPAATRASRLDAESVGGDPGRQA
jgi:hypothetical protein